MPWEHSTPLTMAKVNWNNVGPFLIAFAMLLGVPGGLAAQNPPSWFGDNPLPIEKDATHPAFAGCDSAFHQFAAPKSLNFQEVGIWYHIRHGDLYVRNEPAAGPATERGTLVTGLDYVFGIRKILNQTGDVSGILVIGHRQGKSRLLQGVWPLPTNLSNYSLSQVGVDSLTTEMFLRADLVDDELYFLDAKSEKIGRFIDSNGDGIPETRDSLELGDFNAFHRMIGGFFPSTSSEVGVQHGPSIRGDDEYFVLVPGTTSLLLERRSAGAVQLPRIHSPQLREGMNRLRVFYKEDSIVKVEAIDASGVSKTISANFIVKNPLGFVDIKLKRRITPLDKIRVIDVATSAKSPDYRVEAGRAPWMIPPIKRYVRHGESAIISGANFKKNAGNVVTVMQGKAVVTGSFVTFVTGSSMTFDSTNLTPLLSWVTPN